MGRGRSGRRGRNRGRGNAMRSAVLGAAGLLSVLGACATPSPFPQLPPMDDGAILRLLAERTARDDEIYGELEFDYEDSQNSGSFDVIATFTPPSSMEMFAFKDLVITQEDIFQLSFAPEGFGFSLVHGPNGEPVESSGPLAGFPARHPRFRGFFWAREAFVLPGRIDPEQLAEGGIEVRNLADTRKQITTRISSGASVAWVVRTDTLEVLSARITAPDGSPAGQLRYSRYFLKDGRFFPGKIVFEDLPQDVRVTVYVDVVEVGAPGDDG